MINDDLISFFKGLTDQTRLRILNLLIHLRPLNVNELSQILHLSQSKVSHHLSQLRLAGWVTFNRRDKWVYYRLNSEVPSELILALQNIFSQHLNLRSDLTEAQEILGE